MNPRALIFSGGWEGHHPAELAAIFHRLLTAEQFECTTINDLTALEDPNTLHEVSLIIPVWTMGSITDSQLKPLIAAVLNGAGIAGCHGGMCDAFRAAPDYQFMTGGQWVAHPGNDGVEYKVEIRDPDHPITQGITDYTVKSEQYYMHTDPSNRVLATTRFPTAAGPHTPNGVFDMPVAWTRYHGKGRVFFHSLGHTPDILEQPETLEITRRGLLWAARA